MLTIAPTIDDRQAAAVAVLATLLTGGMPAVTWTITTGGELEGRVDLDGQDRAATVIVHRWARELGASVHADRHHSAAATWLHLHADGHVDGVPVRVGADLNVQPLASRGSV